MMMPINDTVLGSIPTRGMVAVKLLSFSLFWDAKRSVEFCHSTQVKNGEGRVLTLGSLYLPCYIWKIDIMTSGIMFSIH